MLIRVNSTLRHVLRIENGLLRFPPKVETPFESLKTSVMAKVVYGALTPDDLMFRELLALPNCRMEEMRNFFRIKKEWVFAKAVEAVLGKNPNVGVELKIDSSDLPYANLEQSGLLDAAMLEKIGKLEEGGEVEVKIKGLDFSVSKKEGGILAFLKMPYFHVTGKLEQDRTSLEEVLAITGQALQLTKNIGVFEELIKADEGDFLGKQLGIHLSIENHKMRGTLSELYSRAERGLMPHE